MTNMKRARNFHEYGVWKEAVEFASQVYVTTGNMPWFEKTGLCDQLQRAVVSISSNIAEGCAKPSDADFAKYLDQALGSAFEVETQLIIAKKVGYIKEETQYDTLITGISSIQRQIQGLIRSIRHPQPN